MKILFMSDTHGKHLSIGELPSADVLIHSGDVSYKGEINQIEDFIDWFISLNYMHKIFISGNHDFYFENIPTAIVRRMLPQNTFYLCDDSVCIEGINFHGSPVTPWFFNWAFNRHRGIEINKHWKLISKNTDVLITHGPPYGILDLNINKEHTGCEDLLIAANRIKPTYHLFGHIHESYGIHKTESTTFINGCLLNENYCLKNKPVLFDFNRPL